MSSTLALLLAIFGALLLVAACLDQIAIANQAAAGSTPWCPRPAAWA